MCYEGMGICRKPLLDISEDIVGTCNNYYWLLDGATPPVGELNHMHTCFFVEQMNKLLAKYSKQANSTQELLKNVLIDIKEVFKDNNLCNYSYLPYSTLIIVRVLDNYIEYSVLGDSTLGIRVNDDVCVISDDRLKKIAVPERLAVMRLREQGISESSEKYLLARKKLIETEKAFQNVPGGYWVAGMQPEAADNSITGHVFFRKDDKVLMIIVSDGLERLVSVFEKYQDVCEIGDMICEKGEDYIFSQLRKLENDAANFVKPISSKNDDASYIVLKR